MPKVKDQFQNLLKDPSRKTCLDCANLKTVKDKFGKAACYPPGFPDVPSHLVYGYGALTGDQKFYRLRKTVNGSIVKDDHIDFLAASLGCPDFDDMGE